MLARFLDDLFENGRVSVSARSDFDAEDLAAARERLIDLESQSRLNAPAGVPDFDVASAVWAAENVYACCGFLVYRTADEETIRARLQEGHERLMSLKNAKPRADAVLHYSLDIVLRCVPSLAEIARRASHDDVLLDALQGLVSEFPLSSVGMHSPNLLAWHRVFDEHPPLRTMYVDRIIDRGDRERLNSERVQAAVTSAIGLHSGLIADLLPTTDGPDLSKESTHA